MREKRRISYLLKTSRKAGDFTMAKEIVILGGGYGGVLSALTVRKYLSETDVNVTVVNKYPTHQIITELHRLAAGNVSEKELLFL